MRNKYEKALRKIRVKERRLARQAMNDPDRKVRKRAFASISDEGSYAYITLEAPGPGLRAAAVEHVHDDQILGHLALHAGDEHVRRLAVNRIEDEELLGYLATAADDEPRRTGTAPATKAGRL